MFPLRSLLFSRPLSSLSQLPRIQKYSTKDRPSREVRIPVPWGHIAGKWWGPLDKRPVLALHGWQDNCGSFDRLVPLLNDNLGILGIDLPGHGLSSRLPPGMYYHNMNYPIIVRHIMRYFSWPKISLMGHSLGAISVFTYTMLFPDSVDFLICLDGVKPILKKDNVPRMALGLDELLKYDKLSMISEEPPSYPLDEMRKRICEVNFSSIDIKHCDHILTRSVAQSKSDPDKYYFTRDPRIKSRLILNWYRHDILEGAARVTCPLFIAKFLSSHYYEDKENFYEVLEVLKKSSKDCSYNYVEGTHHGHLNNPELFVEKLNKFIAKHDIEDRTQQKVSKQIFV